MGLDIYLLDSTVKKLHLGSPKIDNITKILQKKIILYTKSYHLLTSS